MPRGAKPPPGGFCLFRAIVAAADFITTASVALTRDDPCATMTATREVVAMKLEEALHILAAHQAQLRALSLEQVSVFGSVARNEAGDDSDVDILVEFTPGVRVGMFEFLDIQETLS